MILLACVTAQAQEDGDEKEAGGVLLRYAPPERPVSYITMWRNGEGSPSFAKDFVDGKTGITIRTIEPWRENEGKQNAEQDLIRLTDAAMSHDFISRRVLNETDWEVNDRGMLSAEAMNHDGFWGGNGVLVGAFLARGVGFPYLPEKQVRLGAEWEDTFEVSNMSWQTSKLSSSVPVKVHWIWEETQLDNHATIVWSGSGERVFEESGAVGKVEMKGRWVFDVENQRDVSVRYWVKSTFRKPGNDGDVRSTWFAVEKQQASVILRVEEPQN
jgi:hypothetical protein